MGSVIQEQASEDRTEIASALWINGQSLVAFLAERICALISWMGNGHA